MKLGLIGGVPTIAGAWLGGFVYSPVWSVLFLALGVGAIAQVIGQIARQMGRDSATGARVHVDAGAGGSAGWVCGDVRHGDAGRMSIWGIECSVKVDRRDGVR